MRGINEGAALQQDPMLTSDACSLMLEQQLQQHSVHALPACFHKCSD